MILLAPPLIRLIEYLTDKGIKAILVGGFVRDHFTGDQTLDLDIELYGIDSMDALEHILKPFGKVNSVGKSFGVFKLSYGGYEIDFSPPRIESKQGIGHKGFDVAFMSNTDFTTAARRRDFTINAIGYDPVENVFLDPYGGIDDLKRKRLTCVDPETFVEDPLRVMRAVQFAARFNLECDKKLLRLCQEMIVQGALDELPKERLFEEFKKLFLLSPRPSVGLRLLKLMGGLAFFSPLDQLESTPQDPLSHPEGDVWTHTLMCIDTMASMRTGESKKDLTLMFAVLLHDIAKPQTTIIENGKLNAPHHAEAGVKVSREWLNRITEDKSLIESVLPLVRYHGWPRKLFRTHTGDSDVLRLSRYVCISDLIRVSEADFFGRSFDTQIPASFEAGKWLYETAKRLNILTSPPHPILMGRDLIAMGLSASQRFKTILDAAYDAQLNLEFSTHSDALLWVEKYLVTEL